MAMVTNTCAKHGHAFPEERCPQCVIEETVAMRAVTKKFFDTHRHRQMNELLDQYDVTVEDLYEHFRVRLIEELGLDRGKQ